MTPDERRDLCRRIAPLGWKAMEAKYTEAELTAMGQEHGRRAQALRTPEQRSEWGAKGARIRRERHTAEERQAWARTAALQLAAKRRRLREPE